MITDCWVLPRLLAWKQQRRSSLDQARHQVTQPRKWSILPLDFLLQQEEGVVEAEPHLLHLHLHMRQNSNSSSNARVLILGTDMSNHNFAAKRQTLGASPQEQFQGQEPFLGSSSPYFPHPLLLPLQRPLEIRPRRIWLRRPLPRAHLNAHKREKILQRGCLYHRPRRPERPLQRGERVGFWA